MKFNGFYFLPFLKTSNYCLKIWKRLCSSDDMMVGRTYVVLCNRRVVKHLGANQNVRNLYPRGSIHMILIMNAVQTKRC